MNIQTNLFGKANAVLTKNGKIIAIIKCNKKEDITSKIQKAIEHWFTASDIKITMLSDGILTNQNQVYFTTEQIEDDEVYCRDFKIQVFATY